MKKILAVIVSALLMLSCMVTAFAETVDPATPDEADSTVLPRRFEVIAVESSSKVYTKSDATLLDYPIYNYDDDYLFEGNYKLNVNLEGVKVVFKDNCTGEYYTKVFDGTEPCQIKPIYIYDPDETNSSYSTDVSTNPELWMDIEHFDNVNNGLFFSITVQYNTTDDDSDDNGTSGGNPSDEVSTNDTATSDTATKGTVTNDNGTVQTGSPITTMLFAVAMIMAGGALFLSYRKKFEK